MLIFKISILKIKVFAGKIYKKLYSDDNIIINLASEEYTKTVRSFLSEDNLFYWYRF